MNDLIAKAQKAKKVWTFHTIFSFVVIVALLIVLRNFNLSPAWEEEIREIGKCLVFFGIGLGAIGWMHCNRILRLAKLIDKQPE